MKLLIVSHTRHYRTNDGLVGWEPTIREIDELSRLFDKVSHVAPVHNAEPPSTVRPYSSERVSVRGVLPAGGTRIRDKLKIFVRLPQYLAAVRDEMTSSDVIHVRCPANISLACLLLLAVQRKPAKRWVKYAGNWDRYPGEPISYRIQRALLRRNLINAEVSVNGHWPNQQSHLHTFLNPCLTEEELGSARVRTATKVLRYPVHLLFVGRLEQRKGAARCIQIIEQLRAAGVDSVLSIVGDGPERAALEEVVRQSSVASTVRFYGWCMRSALEEFYERAHFILLPSESSEGWPKVLSEAMAYGAIPLAGRVSSIPQYLEGFGTGRAIPPLDIEAYIREIKAYIASPDRWTDESRIAMREAGRFTYEEYLEAVRRLLRLDGESSPSPHLQPSWTSALIGDTDT